MWYLLDDDDRQAARRALARLCRARDLLRASHGRDVSIREAAGAAALSPWHFVRRFKAVFGETPHQTLMAARLDQVKTLLITSERSVTGICTAVGFSSLGTFSGEFARRVGVSPSRYRKQFRSLVRATGMLPPELVPGCVSLMCGGPEREPQTRAPLGSRASEQFPRSIAPPAAAHSARDELQVTA